MVDTDESAAGTGHHLSRRHLLAAVPAIGLLAAVPGARSGGHGTQMAFRPLHSETVGMAGPWERRLVESTTELVAAGSRVLERSVDTDALVDHEQRWLERATSAGRWDGDQDPVRSALLDLRVLTLSGGAAVAGWSRSWRYVWPRDNAFAVAALARHGYADEAELILTNLQTTLPSSGVYDARYLPDGSGRTPDARGLQRDGSGWVLWGIRSWVEDLAPSTRRRRLHRLLPLVTAAARACASMTSGGTALPAPSSDYWEVAETTTTLGTAAPLASGLSSAAELHRVLGLGRAADEYAAMARTYAEVVRTAFSPFGYGRYPGRLSADAAVTFLMPPFTETAEPDVVEAWRSAWHSLRRPAGGHAPGVAWRDDGISWTPETALFAMTGAASGLVAESQQDLAWLASHRTRAGSFSEKVLADSAPAGVAPLAWTASGYLLASPT